MSTCRTALAVLISLVGVSAAAAQDANHRAADAVVEAARQDCEGFDSGRFTAKADAVRATDLMGDGIDEVIVDAAHFTCTSMASGYCGTGGCQVHVIVDGKPHELLGRAWLVVGSANGLPVFKIGVHWSLCDYTSYCTQSLQWDGNGFASLGIKPEPPEE